MPKVNVYLPDDLAAAVREAGLSVSPICQRALAEAVRVAGETREAVAVLRDPGFDPQRRSRVNARVAARMTPRLRQAIGRARDLAGPAGAVGTAQLLAGVIDEPGNLGVDVLRSLGADVTALREAAARRPAAGEPGRSGGEEPLGGLSTPARRAVAAALEAASDLGHDFLGCEHLVLGLAEQPDGAASALLRERGIGPESVRRAIPAAVAGAALGYADARRLFGTDVAGRLDGIDRRLGELEERLRAGGL